ncbi:UDP-N-acetylglucosamine 4,6-dehydratase family protein [Candidatus Riflebacteria bacterium]
MKNIFKNRVILVTGGTGSIGSEIVRQILHFKPAAVRIFSRDEFKQFQMQQELSKFSNIRYFIGDIRNPERVRLATRGANYVFHAAALKHVPACEYNAFEAVETNVIGTQNLVNAAIEAKVDKFIAISTDKACHPLNVMGATKLLSEKIVTSSQYHKGKSQTVMANVRFGNVLGSRGSVIPLFLNQIKNNQPLTITDPEMSRFFVSIPEAVQLVYKSMNDCLGGEVFIFKMPALTIGTLIDALIELVCEANPDKTIRPKKKIIGIRPGEKMYELLMNEAEVSLCLETPKMYIIRSQIDIPNWRGKISSYRGAKKITSCSYDSRQTQLLSIAECKKMLKRVKLDLKI